MIIGKINLINSAATKYVKKYTKSFFISNFENMDFSEAKDYIVERLVKELPRNLYYHGAHHTFDVVKSVHSLSVAEKLTNADFFVLLTAAYFHDAGYVYRCLLYTSPSPRD